MTKNNKGITLVELIIVVAILGLIMTTLSSLFIFQIKSFGMTRDKGFAQQDNRLVVMKVTKILRTARIIKENFPEGETEGEIEKGWKELNKDVLQVKSIFFTGKGSLLTVKVNDDYTFELRVENEKNMNFDEPKEEIFYKP